MTKRRLTGILAVTVAAGLTLAACGPGDTTPSAPEEPTDTQTDAPDEVETEDTIVLGFLPAWTDGLSTAYLLENQLSKLGYTVEMETLVDAGVLYTGLSKGDVDMYPSAWPEVTHADYMVEYGDNIEDLGAYYEGAKLTIAVPSYVDIDSIEDLATDPGRFGGEIIGIEPGAGLTGQTQDVMMPEYGLDDDYELVTSSTAAMLTTLGKAIDNNEDIVVTLWRPFWANNVYDVKDLEDPKGGMGEAEALHFLGVKGFADRFPEAADYIANIKLSDAQYGELEEMVVEEYGEGREAEAVEAWIAANPDAYEGLISE